jgi:hypothetical protein
MRASSMRALAFVAMLACGVVACGSEGDADENVEAAGELQPAAAPDSAAATPSVPLGGQLGAGTAGDNTGRVRAGDTARATARTGAGGDSSRLRVTPPDTVSRVPNPPPREPRP